MMTHWRMLMLGALVAAPVRAQSAPQSSTHVVSGVVFDSVARIPLAGAVCPPLPRAGPSTPRLTNPPHPR